MKRKQKETLGFTYYIEQGLNAKETAMKCGVSEKTVGAWVQKGNWKDLRTAKETAPNKLLGIYNEILSNLVEQQLELTRNKTAEKSERKSLADEISKISKQIENLKKDTNPSLKTHLYCVEQFVDKLLVIFDKYNIKSELIDFTLEYAKNLAKEQI